MFSYSLKLHVKTFIDVDEKALVIKEVPSKRKLGEIGRLKHDEATIKMRHEIVFSQLSNQEPSTMMKMETVLKFNNAEELRHAFNSAIAKFESDKTIAKIRQKSGYSLKIAFGRASFGGNVPDYAMKEIAEIVSQRQNCHLKFLKKLSAFTPEQKEVLTKLMKESKNNRKQNDSSFLSQLWRSVIFVGTGLFMVSLIVSAEIFPYIAIAAEGVLAVYLVAIFVKGYFSPFKNNQPTLNDQPPAKKPDLAEIREKRLQAIRKAAEERGKGLYFSECDAVSPANSTEPPKPSVNEEQRHSSGARPQ